MKRRIVGFVRDDPGDWVALLDCLHRQHVRHRPPFRHAPWVLDDAERARRIGTDLDCPLCERAELPDDVVVVRTTDTWDAATMPAGLRRAHRVGAATWGRLRVVTGEVRFRAATRPPIDTVVVAGTAQAIPPLVDHEVDPSRDVRFFIEFLRAGRGDAGEGSPPHRS